MKNIFQIVSNTILNIYFILPKVIQIEISFLWFQEITILNMQITVYSILWNHEKLYFKLQFNFKYLFHGSKKLQ